MSWLLNGSKAGGDHVLIQRPHCFCCVNQVVLMLSRCIYVTKAERSVSKQGHLQPCYHWKVRSLSGQLYNGLLKLGRTHFVGQNDWKSTIRFNGWMGVIFLYWMDQEIWVQDSGHIWARLSYLMLNSTQRKSLGYEIMYYYIITKSVRTFWLVNQLWFIVLVNPWKNRSSSELLYKSNKPQVFYWL